MSSATQARRVSSWPLAFVLTFGALGLLTSCGTEEVTFALPADRDMRSNAASDDRGRVDGVVGESGHGEPTLDAGAQPETEADADAAPDADFGRGASNGLAPGHPGLPMTLDLVPATGDAAAIEVPVATTQPHAPDGAPPHPIPVCNALETTPYEPSCTRLAFAPVLAASTTQLGSAVASVLDGDACTSWRSTAGPPQWLLLGRCAGQRCTRAQHIGAIGLFVDGDASRSITVEVQGATTTSAANGTFYNISTTTFPFGWTREGYVQLSVNGEAPEVMRLLFNSGPAAPFVVREIVFLDCQ